MASPATVATSPCRTTSAQQIAAARAEGRPDAELAPPQRDAVGQHAVEADRGERQRQRGERAEDGGEEPRRGDRGRQAAGQRADLDDGGGRIDAADDVAQRAGHGERIARGADASVMSRRIGTLGTGELVDLRARLRRRSLRADVAHHADDRRRRLAVAQADGERPAHDRPSVAQVVPGEGLADDHRAARRRIGRRERASLDEPQAERLGEAGRHDVRRRPRHDLLAVRAAVWEARRRPDRWSRRTAPCCRRRRRRRQARHAAAQHRVGEGGLAGRFAGRAGDVRGAPSARWSGRSRRRRAAGDRRCGARSDAPTASTSASAASAISRPERRRALESPGGASVVVLHGQRERGAAAAPGRQEAGDGGGDDRGERR